MQNNELQPPGFEPQLINVLTLQEVQSGLVFLQRSFARLQTKSLGEVIRRVAANPGQRERYQNISGASYRLIQSGVQLREAEAVYVWSTVDPNTNYFDFVFTAQLKPEQRAYKGRPLPEDEQRKLLAFFRENIKGLPRITESWAGLPSPVHPTAIDEILAEDGPQGVSVRFRADPESFLLPEAKPVKLRSGTEAYLEELKRRREAAIQKGNYSDAIRVTNLRLRETEQKFPGEEQKAVAEKLFMVRALIQRELLMKGPFLRLPFGHKLRSLGFLSVGADLMRADQTYGFHTLRGGEVAESFGEAGMEFLQRKIVEVVFGQGTEVVYRDTGNPVKRFSDPGDIEIAHIQRNVVRKLQGIV